METFDPFVSTEPEIELDEDARRVLDERIESADEQKMLTAEAARQRIHELFR
ncbi:MAG TPA: hypothetical protein VGL53_04405 [Bryobacteraceae bacterium]